MNEVSTLVTSCINCVSPGSLSATLAVILIGAGIAWTAERRKLCPGSFTQITAQNKKPPEGGS